MSILVIGGTGTVGSTLVRALRARGESVRVLTRSPDKAAALPDGVEGVVGDLLETDGFDRVFGGSDRLFLLNAVSATELQEGTLAVAEAKRRGYRHVVYMSVQAADALPEVPHFAAKAGIERALHASGVPATILRPNHFFQNDAWLQEPVMRHGIYPQPIGEVGISRVDVQDIADAAASAFADAAAHAGRTYTLAGPDVLTGPDCARILADALGRPVQYLGDLDAWSAQMRQMLPGWMVYDFAMMFAEFQRTGLAATDRELEELQALLGRAPRRFEPYARALAAQWSA